MIAALAAAAWSLQFQAADFPRITYQQTLDGENFTSVSVIQLDHAPREGGGWIETSTVLESLVTVNGEDIRDNRERKSILVRNDRGLILKGEDMAPAALRMARLTRFVAPDGPVEPEAVWKIQFPANNNLPTEVATYTLSPVATRSMPPQVRVSVSITQNGTETGKGTWVIEETTGKPIGFTGEWLAHPSVEMPVQVGLELLPIGLERLHEKSDRFVF